jgi:hypothetical protein
LNDELDKLVKEHPQLQNLRDKITIDLIEAPQPPLSDQEKLFLAWFPNILLLDRPAAPLGTVRISVSLR